MNKKKNKFKTNYKILIFLLFNLFLNVKLYANDLNENIFNLFNINNSFQLIDTLKVKDFSFNNIFSSSANTIFTVVHNSNHNIDIDNNTDTDNSTIDTNESKYISPESFLYADTRRYILTGGTPLKITRIKPVEFSIFAGLFTGILILQHELQMNTIWKEHSSKFRIIEDAKYSIYIDKPGHAYGSYIISYIFREALVSSGFSWNSSNNIGAALGLGYSTYIEILDGFGENWGFSPSDWYADLVGAAFFAAQNYVPFLQNFSPKFMYFPAEWFGHTSRIPHDLMNDDYASQTFFLSINVYNLLPEKIKKYYPEWLELSIGYAVRNILAANSEAGKDKVPCSECISLEPNNYGSPRLILSLDYNLVKLLPDGCNFWNWCKQSLNLFKLPSPALEIGKVTRFYLLFPFKLNL